MKWSFSTNFYLREYTLFLTFVFSSSLFLSAPEILQGKYGHSFEVDVWSTGVIIYTLLVGKPPYESKDVKSTYKRILANSFSFPDTQQPICDHAKGLVRNILQVGHTLKTEHCTLFTFHLILIAKRC